MAKRFQTVLKRARFVVEGYAPETMSAIGGGLRNSIDDRLGRGLNAYDQAGRALAPRYAEIKRRRGLKPVRDWFRTGRTRRSLQVLEAAVNKAKIGFTDTLTRLRAAANNRRELAFAVSPNDRNELVESVRRADSPVKAKVA